LPFMLRGGRISLKSSEACRPELVQAGILSLLDFAGLLPARRVSSRRNPEWVDDVLFSSRHSLHLQSIAL